MRLHPFIKKFTWQLATKSTRTPTWRERAESISLATFKDLEGAVTRHARHLPKALWDAIDPMADYQTEPAGLLALLDRHYALLPQAVRTQFDQAMYESDVALGVAK
jgi:hypothetical protein